MQQQCQNDLIGDHTELGTGTSGEQYENQCCTRTRRETTKKTTAEGKHAQNNEENKFPGTSSPVRSDRSFVDVRNSFSTAPRRKCSREDLIPIRHYRRCHAMELVDLVKENLFFFITVKENLSHAYQSERIA